MKRHQAAVLTAAGSDIRETVSIYRAGDPRCCPSGGKKARIWRWNGTRLVAGPWRQVTPGAATSGYFKTPSGNIVCFHSPGPKDYPQSALVVRGSRVGSNPRRPIAGARRGATRATASFCW